MAKVTIIILITPKNSIFFTSIGNWAFYDCSGLTSVTIPNSVTSIGEWAFSNCSGLTSVMIPNSVTSIGSKAFYGCCGLTSVTIPNNVTNIGDYTFFECSGLASVTIPNSVTSIGDLAFFECSGLASVTIGNSVTSIGERAFYKCSGLTSVTIPNSVMTIGYGTFLGCSGLTSITIPNSVTSIGEFAFAYCSSLTSVTISNSMTNIEEWAFSNCNSLSSVAIPNSVTSIEDGAFSMCSGLTSVTIPNSVTNIGSYAFRYCSSLTSITIPNSVTSIGGETFIGCSSLTSVISEIETPFTFGSSAFSSIGSTCTLTVPAGTKAAYIAAGWTEEVFKGGIMEIADIADGVYYIKNVETGKYLTQGNSWNRHAVLNATGLPARFVKQTDGSYTITFTRGSSSWKQLFRDNEEGVFVDYNGQATGCPFWTITNAGAEGTYRIQTLVSDSRYGQGIYPNTCLGNDPDKEAEDEAHKGLGLYNDVDGNVTAAEGMNITWELIPTTTSYTLLQESQMLLLIDLGRKLGVNTVQAEASVNSDYSQEEMEAAIGSLRSTIMERLADGVDESLLPLDLTALISNPSFVSDNADGWSGSVPAFQRFNNAEFFQRTFDFYQTVSGLPNGNYQVAVKGFHRPGNYQSVYSSYMQGTDNASAQLYANSDSKTLLNIVRHAQDEELIGLPDADELPVSYDGTTQYLPNTMFAAYYYFNQGFYENELPVTVTDGNLTLGIRLSQYVSSGWVIFDDFRLTYLAGTKNVLSVDGPIDVSQASNGEDCEIVVRMDYETTETVVGYGFALYLPENIRPYSTDSDGNFKRSSVTISTETHDEKVADEGLSRCGRKLSDGGYSFLWLDQNDKTPLKSTHGELMRIKVSPDANGDGIVDAADKAIIQSSVNKGYIRSINIANSDNQALDLGNIADVEFSFVWVGKIFQTLDMTDIPTLTYGGTYQLPASTNEGQTLTWTVADPTIASVSDGLLTALKAGTTSVTATQAGNDDYLPFSREFALTVAKAALTVTADDKTKEKGEENPTLTVSYSGFVNGDNALSLTTQPTVSTTATTTSPAGMYPITVSGAVSGNYEFTYVNGTLTVTEKPAILVPTDISQMDNAIYIEPTAGLSGTTIDLCVKLKNSLTPVGCAFKLTLPDGLQLQKDEDGDVVYQMGSRAKKMSLTRQDWNNGTYDFALTPSTGTATISGSDDVIVTFKLPIPENMAAGDYALKLTKCLIQSKADGTTTDYPLSDVVTTLTVEDYVIGDVNGDRKVTPSDAIMILYHYFDVEQTGFKVKAADVNGDGSVTPADAIEALYIYFNDGSQSNARQMQQTLDPQ